MSYKDVDDVIRENYQLEKENEELKEKIEEEKRKEEKGNELIKDEELDKIKKELDERKEELKRKDKKYREIKRGYKNNKDKIKTLNQQIKDMENLIEILSEEYKKYNRDDSIKEKVNFDICTTSNELNKEDDEISQMNIKADNDIEVRENIYSSLCDEYGKLNKEIYMIEQKIISTNESISKNKEKTNKIESYITLLKSKFDNSKSLYASLDASITTKLYFIRFSNSLLRSFFNIINTRRVQIEILRSIPSSSFQSLSPLFSQLNHYQSHLTQNYYDFLSLLESSSNI